MSENEIFLETVSEMGASGYVKNPDQDLQEKLHHLVDRGLISCKGNLYTTNQETQKRLKELGEVGNKNIKSFFSYHKTNL